MTETKTRFISPRKTADTFKPLSVITSPILAGLYVAKHETPLAPEQGEPARDKLGPKTAVRIQDAFVCRPPNNASKIA